MSKLTSRDIQMCVAGAFALTGFYALYWLPYHIVTTHDALRISSYVVAALALPLGISIVLGSSRALLLARIYLWLEVIGGFIFTPLYCILFPARATNFLLRMGPDLTVSLILLVLIIWSRSKRFKQDPAA